MKFIGAIILGIILCFKIAKAEDCLEWFNNAKIMIGPECLVKCNSTKVDMSTFQCTNMCDKMCKLSQKERFLFKLTDLYPGLTIQEKDLAAKYPSKVYKAYKLSWQAQRLCLDLYPTSATNDASDACRHFTWSGLLVKEFGRSFAEKILNAHEQEPKQPIEEKKMDVFNNQIGISSSEMLIKNKIFTEDRLLKEYSKLLNDKKLKILKTKAGSKK